MRYLILFCFSFLLLSCSNSSSSSDSETKRSIKPNADQITFKGEHPDNYSLVLFTCDRFGLKSKLASAYFNKRAKELDLNYRASAKSLNMSSSSAKLVPNKVIKTYSRKGISIRNPAIVGFRTTDVDKFEAIYMLDEFSRYGENDRFVDWKDVMTDLNIQDTELDNLKSKIDAVLGSL